MSFLIEFALYLTALWLLLLMLWQGLKGTVDLLSLRNIFLLGFVVFQLISGGMAIQTPSVRDFGLIHLPRTAVIYSTIMILFLGLFFWTYRRAWGVDWFVRHTPVGSAAPASGSMYTLAFVFLGVGLLFRLVLIYVPIAGPAFNTMGSGMLAVSAGMAAWVWGGRMFNPAVVMMTAVITLLALAGVLQNDFGRRSILGVIGCFGWGAYHGHWKHLDTKVIAFRLVAIGSVGFLFVAAFTATRSGAERDRGLGEKVSLLQQADLKKGVVQLLSGQDAGRNSMWMIENYPSRYPYQTLHTMRYFLFMPIPRRFYLDKPEALGRVAVRQANADRKRGSNYSIGPGIIGHIATDNPFLALPVYAIFGGLFLAFLDRLIRWHPNNPFVVLPVGTTLGQIVGLARGETGLFLFNAVGGIFAAWVGMYLAAKIMSAMGWQIQAEEEDDYSSEELNDDNWEAGPYGSEGHLSDGTTYSQNDCLDCDCGTETY